MTVQKIKSGRIQNLAADDYVGDLGTIFFNEDIGDLRIGDGQTVGGIPLSGGEGGASYILPTASTTVKGGVKIDGSTVTILNQVISVGSIPYSKISDPPTIPTSTSQLSNGSGYITSAALSGYATETYVTSRGYLTTVSWDSVTSKPTLFNPAAITQDLIPDTNVTVDLGSTAKRWRDLYLSGTTIDLAGATISNVNGTINLPANTKINGSTIPLDISDLTDNNNVLAASGAGYSLPTATGNVLGGIKIGAGLSINASGVVSVTTVGVTSYNDLTDKPNLAATYSWSIAGDDSTQREISARETVKFIGASGVTTASDTEGNITITGPSLAGLATETYVTNRGYITSSALTGLATETYVTTRGYLTSVDYSVITGKPTLFDGAYTSLSGTPTLFSGSYTDLTNKPSIPSITGLATETYVTTQGYITSAALTGLATETYVTNRGYITSSALTGLATETYVTTQGYLTAVDYSIITNKPTLVTSYNSLTDLPTLFGGSYTDLSNKPTIPTDVSNLTDTTGLLSVSFDGSYNSLTNKPAILTEADVFALSLILG